MTAPPGDDDELDDPAAFGSMRAMFRDMAAATDEEPSSRGLDALMAAARAQVAPPAPGPMARFAAWFSALARQPAFGAAVTLVAVASVGGILAMRGGAPPERSAAPATEAVVARAEGAATVAPAPTGGAGRGGGAAPVVLSPAPPVESPPAPAPAKVDGRVAPTMKPAASSSKAGPAPVAEAKKLDEDRSPEPAMAADVATTVTEDFDAVGDSTMAGAGGGGASRGDAPTAPAAPITRSTTAAPAERGAAVRAAAERGDCATARRLASSLSSAERRALRAASKAVAACLTSE